MCTPSVPYFDRRLLAFGVEHCYNSFEACEPARDKTDYWVLQCNTESVFMLLIPSLDGGQIWIEASLPPK
jgi:hypothetical protein